MVLETLDDDLSAYERAHISLASMRYTLLTRRALEGGWRYHG